MVSSSSEARPSDRNVDDPVSRAQDLEPIYDAFESAWRSDERPKLAEYLAKVPPAAHASAFGHLLALELSYRRDIGERPAKNKCRQAFPEFGNIIEEVFLNGYVDSSTDGSKNSPGSIGRYELIQRLGAGGQAEVFLARHGLLGHEVVVKLARHACHDHSEEDSLINEGRILARLEHPALAEIQDLGFREGRPFLVMRYENGHSLTRGVNNARFELAEAARIVLAVAEAVALAHEQGVYHLDIKPGNVLLRNDGSPCLIDFGLAQLAKAVDPNRRGGRSVVGTVAFMPPEQAAGDWSRIGPRSDVFGLGALLYWFLTGLAPFHGPTYTQCIDCAKTGELDTRYLGRSDIPHELTAIALKAMAPDPMRRFQSVEAFAEALRQFLHRDRRRKRIGRVWAAVTAVGNSVDDCVQGLVEGLSTADSQLQIIRGIAVAVVALLLAAVVLLWLLMPFFMPY